jgi:(1->4)-alpha-D-glucan 1-alpha-D-glucosylmutase
MPSLRIPIATYRLQLNERFRFEDARALVSYLHRLGITDLYASPIFKARKGTTHGYDITNPLHLNPELGTEEEFEALVQELKGYGMGLLLDIVPNHMVASPENPWWADVLENGQDSPYAASSFLLRSASACSRLLLSSSSRSLCSCLAFAILR